jgi:hypothetical protein
VRLACLGLLLDFANNHVAAEDSADAGIAWFPITQSSPPSKIAELRRGILTFLDPLKGTNLHMRVIADVTQAVTNASPGTVDAPASEAVSIRTLFQSALEARVPNGGCVAVWNKRTGGDEQSYLLLISPVIQTNSSSPPLGAVPKVGQPGAQTK